MSTTNFGVLITVSLKSKRLKKKALLEFGKQTIIENIIDRMKKICDPKKIIIITSNKKIDLPFKQIAHKKGIRIFFGDPIDVLHRMYEAAKKFKIKNFISTTGDNPFVDYLFAKKMINYHIKNKFDFTEIIGLPWGAFCYGVSLIGLDKIMKNKKKRDTEVWGNYFRKNKYCINGLYKINHKKLNIKKLRLTVDYKADYELVKKILSLSKKNFPLSKEIVKIIQKNKKLIKINSHIKQKKIPKKYY